MRARLLATVLLVLMFLLSGVHKILTFGSSVSSLVQHKWTLAPHAFMVGAIVLEIVAPVLIVLHAMGKADARLNAAATIGLIVFTVIATAVYHPPKWGSYMANIPLMSNTSLVGGLSLLLLLPEVKN